jgi:hypothetical protein
MWDWGLDTAFTDLDGDLNWGALTAFTAHRSASSLQCYADPAGHRCDDRNHPAGFHAFGIPLQQAVWESAHGTNCFVDDGQPCWQMPDSFRADTARNAFFYALTHTPTEGTFVTFSAQFLSYYYNSASVDAWGNRWWVFNHHRLVGPNYGYSRCHLY